MGAGTTFLAELEELINAHSMENGSNTPDYLLAAYLSDCLITFDKIVSVRDHWYGVHLEPGKTFFHQDRPKDGIPAFVDARCHYVNCDNSDKETYRMIGGCMNCHTKPILGIFTVGHKCGAGVLGPECPACSIRELYWERIATEDEIPMGFDGQDKTADL